MEERFLADAAQGAVAARIESVSLRRDHRHPRSFRRLSGAALGIDWALSPVAHQLLAMVVGGIAGLVAIVGLTILLVRRLGDPRIRLNSRKWDIAVALMLWLQLVLGLLTVPLSAFHMDGVLFETLTSYVKGIVTLDGSAAALMIDVPLTYKLHILLGFTLFLVSPFTRMIHIWSGAGALAYLFRPYQIVRTPRTRAKEPVRS